MKLSIVIRCFNEEEHIGKLLTGIEHQELKDTEVIIVDSGSTDSTVAIASKFQTKIVRIKPEEFSFGRALNLGCAAASGDFLLFASAHVFPLYNNWLSLMTKPFEDDSVALVYGKQRGDERNKYSEHQLFKQWFPEKSNYNQQLPFCNNANCVIRRSLWQDQHFDEELTGLEDLDWAKKILSKGHKIVYQADAVVIHVHEENAKQIRNRYRREAMALQRINPDTRISFWKFIELMLRNVTHDIVQASRDGRLMEKFFEIWMFRYNQFYGTYLGHKESGKSLDQDLRKKYYYPPSKTKLEENMNDQKRIHYND